MNILITGGAGFIGTNAAEYFLKQGNMVWIFDNLSRNGSTHNVKQLLKEYPNKLKFIKGDIRSPEKVRKVIEGKDIIFHLAAQVAVTTSIANPREDFEINVHGTLNVLEAVRLTHTNPVLIYSSTNKVYGNLEDLEILEDTKRYKFKNLPHGVSEKRNIDFHSPYGCSKGAADQYVRDYSRIYGLNTIVFRQSCIYGPHQFGMEDQGWVAWFLILPFLGKKVNIYGNGKQVRDLLYVEDLVEAYDQAIKHIHKTKGEIYNIGGGSNNTLSIWWEFKDILEDVFKKKMEANFLDWRAGDQPIFVSDVRKAFQDFKWKPKVTVQNGIETFHHWVKENKDLFIKKTV